jgi:hypothetical protein
VEEGNQGIYLRAARKVALCCTERLATVAVNPRRNIVVCDKCVVDILALATRRSDQLRRANADCRATPPCRCVEVFRGMCQSVCEFGSFTPFWKNKGLGNLDLTTVPLFPALAFLSSLQPPGAFYEQSSFQRLCCSILCPPGSITTAQRHLVPHSYHVDQ